MHIFVTKLLCVSFDWCIATAALSTFDGMRYSVRHVQFLAPDAFITTNCHDIAIMFVSVSVWDGRAL